MALVREVSKFGTVGGVSFLIDLAIFNVLLAAGFETLVAKTISTTAGVDFVRPVEAQQAHGDHCRAICQW